MKKVLLAGLLIGLAGCEGNDPSVPVGPGPTEPGYTDSFFMQVSAREHTWLKLETRWRGGFGGEAHNDYTLYYVRERPWWQDDERHQVDYWIGGKRGEWERPLLRRVDSTTIAVDLPRQVGGIATYTYTFKGPWPN